jgi:hypothetical protein
VETEDGEYYLVVLPALWSQLRPVLQNVDLFTVMDWQGTVALWPVNLSKTYDGHDVFIDRATEGDKAGRKSWYSVWDNALRPACGTFDEDVDPEPEWPDATFEELLNAAFRDRVISDLGHPVLQSIGR